MERFIPLSVPNLNGNELSYVSKAVEDGWVSSSGPDISLFEQEFANFLEVGSACAVQSGTAGLHLCLRHFGIGAGDIVLVPTLTFIATINPICYQNAEPIFFDCDDHLCIDVKQIEKYLSEDCIFDGEKTIDKVSGKWVKAIMAVHIFGDYADMEAIMFLAEKFRLIVIEDATEALGTKISKGKFSGIFAGNIGHAGVFSFNGNKIMTTGGGGMIIAQDQNALDHMRYLSQQAKDDVVYFINNEIGYNYRMTNLQAALGRAQLEQLPSFIEVKRNNYKQYSKLLEKSNYMMLDFRDSSLSNCWFYSLLTGEKSGKKRDELIQFFLDNKIQTRPLWKLNHLQKPFLLYRRMSCKNAENYYAQIVNLPCSTNLCSNDIEYICSVLAEYKG